MILDDIVAKTRERVARDIEVTNLDTMIELAKKTKNKLSPFAFEKALQGKDIGFICEVKKASPSKGIIAQDFPYIQIAKDYERAGAACISVLTEPDFFCGSDEYLRNIKQVVNIPIIRKDFIIDKYQIYQAKVIGADCVLLICSILDRKTLEEYISICNALSLSALIEVHDEDEVKMALEAGARLIGVNNRNLKDFTVNINNSMSLRKLVPDDVVFIAESGIKVAKDIKELRSGNVNGVLVGETLMRADDKARQLNILRGTKIKICGLTRLEDIEAVNKYKPDYVGFVFASSKRFVNDSKVKELKAMLSNDIQAVGVFVNDVIEHIANLCEENIIDIIQLHGDEDESYINKLKKVTNKPIIKAIRVKNEDDINKGINISSNYILLDAYSENAYGGTGISIDNNLLPANYRPYFLAGGIDSSNVE